jgi:hypothetical protein
MNGKKSYQVFGNHLTLTSKLELKSPDNIIGF